MIAKRIAQDLKSQSPMGENPKPTSACGELADGIEDAASRLAGLVDRSKDYGGKVVAHLEQIRLDLVDVLTRIEYESRK